MERLLLQWAKYSISGDILIFLSLDHSKFKWYVIFVLLLYISGILWHPRDLQVPRYVVSFEFSSLIHHSFYQWFYCFMWQYSDGLGNLQQSIYCRSWGRGLGSRNTSWSHYVAVIQRITSCHKNRMTTRVITLWRVDVTSLTTAASKNNVYFIGD